MLPALCLLHILIMRFVPLHILVCAPCLLEFSLFLVLCWQQAVSYFMYLYFYLTSHQDEISKDPNKHGSTFMPIILSSNNTTVSVGTGNNEYYPLYASIGNVHNNVWHAHHDALVIIGFLAIPKSMCQNIHCYCFI
jgi:hypothetical protein